MHCNYGAPAHTTTRVTATQLKILRDTRKIESAATKNQRSQINEYFFKKIITTHLTALGRFRKEGNRKKNMVKEHIGFILESTKTYRVGISSTSKPVTRTTK